MILLELNDHSASGNITPSIVFVFVKLVQTCAEAIVLEASGEFVLVVLQHRFSIDCSWSVNVCQWVYVDAQLCFYVFVTMTHIQRNECCLIDTKGIIRKGGGIVQNLMTSDL